MRHAVAALLLSGVLCAGLTPVAPHCLTPRGDRYVVMLSAFEQMNKNIAVVAEVAAWARKLGRTFVEPMYCYSRVAPPFDSMEAGGPVLRKELGNHAGKLREISTAPTSGTVASRRSA